LRPFGFSHGFGLATKIQEFDISRDGLQPNLLVFNVGVEIGQLLALAAINQRGHDGCRPHADGNSRLQRVPASVQ
jgi:hypothetical protein